MKTRYMFSALALSAGLILSSGAAMAQYQQGPPPPPPQGGYQGGYQNGPGGPGGPGGWDAPPPEFQDEIHQRGFRDGVIGAQKDFGNHRRPNVNNRDEFRHPNLPGNLRRDYRDGFRRGYDVGVRHLYAGSGPGGPRY